MPPTTFTDELNGCPRIIDCFILVLTSATAAAQGLSYKNIFLDLLEWPLLIIVLDFVINASL